MDTYILKEFVLKTAMLWKEHKKREFLYMQMIRKENLGNLRRLCNQGHISAVLFQKELQWVYDYFKCNLNDGELSDYPESEVKGGNTLETVEDMGVLLRVLKETEWYTIRQYQSLIKLVDSESEVFTILRDHIDRLNEFCDNLSNQIIYISPRPNHRFERNDPIAFPV